MYKRLLIAAACIYLTFSACSSNALLTDLEAGSTTFSIQQHSSQLSNAVFDHTFKNRFKESPKVALAMTGFNIYFPNITEWVITPSRISQTGLSIQFTQLPSYWITAQVSFIASSRKDVILGSQLATFPSVKNNVATVTLNLNTQITDLDRIVSRSFVTGFRRVSGNSLDLKVFSRTVTESTLIVNIQTGIDLEINGAQFNYIIFNPSKVSFASYGGAISRTEYSGSFVENIQREVHDSRYSFYGLVSLKTASQGQFQLSSQLIDQFYVKVDSLRQLDEFTFYFIIMGVPTRIICAECDDKYMNQNQCVRECPSGSYVINYRDGAKGCRGCPSQLNMILNPARDGCVCAPGYFSRNGLCLRDQQITFGSSQATSSGSSGSTSGSSGSTAGNSGSTTRNSGSTTGNTGTTSTSVITNSNRNIDVVTSTSTVTAPPTPAVVINPSRPTSTTTSSSTNVNPDPTQNRIPNQFYTPSVPDQTAPRSVSVPNLTSFQPGSNITPPKYQIQDCSKLPNSYWTGYRCTCKVGYSFENGICVTSGLNGNTRIFKPAQFIYKISYLYTNQKPITCDKSNEIYDGQSCVCLPGYTRNQSGDCISQIPEITCPFNSKLINGICICDYGFVKKNQKCVQEDQCPEYAFHNGIQCVCNDGYYMSQNKCIFGKPCPPYSERKNGNCVCLPGFKYSDGNCIRCPQGQVYIASEDRCVVTCGVNQLVNPKNQQCECKPGFGKYAGICNLCPKNFFIANGYCVICPVGSTYNQQQQKCICGAGLIMHSSGSCQQKCNKPNQIYHAPTDQCKCFKGLANINGNCEICPGGLINPNTQECQTGCPSNQILSGGKCICRPGLGLVSNGVCADCSTIRGKFLVDGYCAQCPTGQIYQDYKCRCPPGKILKDNQCSDACSPGQLVDGQGNCFWCQINQEIVNGKCQCKKGYVKNGHICQQKCRPNQYLINGLCAHCALNTVFNPKLQACVCPEGFYMNNYGVCEGNVLPPVTCPSGQYFSKNQGCVKCPAGCSECENALTCTKCAQIGFVSQGGICVAKCGDGKIVGGQKCDDNNIISGDGCSRTCQIETGYDCAGSPSKCTPKSPKCGDGFINGYEKCDDKNMKDGDGCSSQCSIENGYDCNGVPSICKKIGSVNMGMQQEGKVLINERNVFVLLRTDKKFTFDSDSEMRSFMKYNFPNPQTQPSSAYCIQQPANPFVFRCLIIYSYGVPNYEFNVNFSFNHKGDQGALTVKVDPMSNSFQTRSLV